MTKEELKSLLEKWAKINQEYLEEEERYYNGESDDSYYYGYQRGEGIAWAEYCDACKKAGVEPNAFARENGYIL